MSCMHGLLRHTNKGTKQRKKLPTGVHSRQKDCGLAVLHYFVCILWHKANNKSQTENKLKSQNRDSSRSCSRRCGAPCPVSTSTACDMDQSSEENWSVEDLFPAESEMFLRLCLQKEP